MKLILLLLVLLSSFSSIAQQNNVSNNGELYGKIKDPSLNLFIEGATVAVYHAKDTSLIYYHLANRIGEFKLAKLPLNSELMVVFSFMGYQSINKFITINNVQKTINLGVIELRKSTNTIEEVFIGIPPVRMNRDTIEFFAEAFHLEPSATVDDLIRKFPGLLVWGDGTITYNGRTIQSLKVNGKDFFGGNTKVATYNLPKEAVNKVQVYNKISNSNSLDTLLEMNVNLKKDKNNGFFGKISSGYGNNRRYAHDLSLNYFSKRIQVSAVFASNNTNKIVNDVSSLLKNSTFKGDVSLKDYEPDFKKDGLNRYRASGFLFQYDFLKNKLENSDENILDIQFFHKKTSLELNRKEDIHYQNLEENNFNRKFDVLNHDVTYYNNFSSNYKYSKGRISGYLKTQGYKNLADLNSNSKTETFAVDNTLINNSILESFSNRLNEKIGIEGGFNYSDNNVSSLIPIAFLMNFGINFNQNFYKGKIKRDFIAFGATNESDSRDRIVDSEDNLVNKWISIRSMPIQRLLLGTDSRFNIYLSNILTINNSEINKQVLELNEHQEYILKENLLNISNLEFKDNKAGLHINRTIDLGSLTYRFEKKLSISSAVKFNNILYNNTSIHSFQEINRNYFNVLPELNIKYQKYKNGSGTNEIGFNYTSRVYIPNIDRLAPIIDSIDIYNIFIGNLALKEAYHHNFNLSYAFIPSSNSKGMNFNLNLQHQFSDSYIGRNIRYNKNGGQVLNFQNFANYNSSELRLSLSKSKKISTDHLFLLNFSAGSIYSQIPGKINDILIGSNSWNYSGNINLNYTFKNSIYMNVAEYCFYSKYKSSDMNNNKFQHSNKNFTTKMDFSWKIGNVLTFSSNLSVEKYIYSNGHTNQYYLLNASINKRFRKQKDIEINFGGYDLLKQNRNISFFSDPTMISIVQNNAITNYYYISLAYYPRKFFGKK